MGNIFSSCRINCASKSDLPEETRESEYRIINHCGKYYVIFNDSDRYYDII
jgi:hypothetical protein